MHKDGPLKNIFKDENWNQVGNAKDFMYTRKQNDQYSIEREHDKHHEELKHEEAKHDEQKHDEQKHESQMQSQTPSVDTSRIKEEVSKLKAEKDQEVGMIVSKINDLIARQNRIESSLDEIKANLSELSKQVTLYIKKPAPESLVVERKEPHDKPIDRNNVAPSEVTIEKMFNFSNKKF